MRSEPCDIGSLDEPRTHSYHVAILDNPRPCRTSGGQRRHAGTHWNRLFATLPDAVIPLSDESCPLLNRQVGGFFSDMKRPLLIAVHGCRQHIKSGELA